MHLRHWANALAISFCLYSHPASSKQISLSFLGYTSEWKANRSLTTIIILQNSILFPHKCRSVCLSVYFLSYFLFISWHIKKNFSRIFSWMNKSNSRRTHEYRVPIKKGLKAEIFMGVCGLLMRKMWPCLAFLGAISMSVAVNFFRLKSIHLGEEIWLKIKGWLCLWSVSIYSEGNFCTIK